jgi:1,2-diacylglycerol 3-alpha-glucosyltransferase
MRIAMLTNNYKPFVGGVPISVERQARELIKRGNQVTVFAPEYDSDYWGGGTHCAEEIDGTGEEYSERIIRYKTTTRKMENGLVCPRLIIPEIMQVFAEESFDCIHVHHPMFVGPVALYLGKKYSIPVIYTYHTKYEDYLHYLKPFHEIDETGFFLKKIYNIGREKVVPGYMKWFTNQCDLILAPSAGMLEIVKRRGTKTPVAVFPTGLDDAFYVQDKVKAAAINKLYRRGRSHLFCTISRLEEEKNLCFLLRGIARLKEKRGADFRVLLIGEGSMREKMENMSEELGITEEIVFMGGVENTDIKNYLCACELFLFSSKSETQGIVLAEALAAGNPVVAVNATGVEDVIISGKNGYLSTEDIDEWSERISDALETENYKALKAYAQQTASVFRASGLAFYEETLYEQCINKRAKEEKGNESKATWGEHLSASIYRLFKAS